MGSPMDRCAVFVDAGYLFAQGSAAIAGSKKRRAELVLDVPVIIAHLKELAAQKAPGCSLLRVYWYDGAIGGGRPTSDQALIANLDDMKLRLGFINSHGQQKGVDSLIVTDLIELARLKSVSDAVLLSGDEDVRVGVQIAQNYGVRIHLLGIAPSRSSQSNQLLQEADTTFEWDKDVIETFLSLRESGQDTGTCSNTLPEAAKAVIGSVEPDTEKIASAVKLFVQKLTEPDIKGIQAYWETARGVPPDLDKKLLPACGQMLDRKLEREEIRYMRVCFQQEVKGRVD